MFRNANKFFEFFFGYSITEMNNASRISTETEINLLHITTRALIALSIKRQA